MRNPWLLAARPKTLTAAAAPVLVGAGLGDLHGTFRLLPVLAALGGALLIQIGTNLANDYYDFRRGSDTEARVGPLRVTQAGLLAAEVVRRGAFVVLALALLVGVYLVRVGGWPIAVVGILSLVCAVAYSGGPYPLAYHGLGDLFVFLFFGLVAVGGTYWVQARALPGDAVLAGAGVGFLATAILVANNFRDLESDARTGKRTLAVRVGPLGTKVEFGLLVGAGLAVPVVGVVLGLWPRTALLALLSGGPALAAAARVFRHGPGEDPRRLIPALGATAAATGLYGALLGLGLAAG